MKKGKPLQLVKTTGKNPGEYDLFNLEGITLGQLWLIRELLKDHLMVITTGVKKCAALEIGIIGLAHSCHLCTSQSPFGPCLDVLWAISSVSHKISRIRFQAL